jgi:phage terminase large subunit-like protein
VAATWRPEELKALLDELMSLDTFQRFNKIKFWKPYPKQLEFIRLGSTVKERLLMAGNQNGKSDTGGFESAVHLTGRYPDWWPGRKWERPVRAWADGETSLLVRDVQQKKLCGQPGVDEAFGTGFIPREDFVDKSLARGVTDAYDTIQVKHYRSDCTPDGVSTLTFKSYEQGQKKHQGEPIDFDWCDEEPPEDVYSEIVTRTTATRGMVFTTFTPLQGMSNVVRKFLDEPSPHRQHIVMTIEDAEHIPAEEREAIIASWPAHERDARARGIPMMGSGRIFPYPHESIIEQPIQHIPAYWVKLWGIDFGIDHPFAAVLILWDKDNDVIHIHHTIRMVGALPIQHAKPMLAVGASVPVAWPQDGNQRSKDGTGAVLATSYRKEKLLMLPKHATWPEGGLSTEAAIVEMNDRITTGRLKIASHLADWLHEFDLYHRKDGMIVKVNDDLLSATQKALMMKRFARAVSLGRKVDRRDDNGGMAQGVDFDLF